MSKERTRAVVGMGELGAIPEPDWGRLPFKVDRRGWRCYAEVKTGEEAMEMIQGGKAREPPVWIEWAAAEAVARDAGVEAAAAFLEMGAGVLRWHRGDRPADSAAGLEEGKGLADFRFAGAPGLVLNLGRLGGCYLVYVPRQGVGPQPSSR